MKPLKLMLGLGAACAVCCAIPLLGLAGGLSAFAAALWACVDEFVPAALVLLVVAAGLVVLRLRKRRAAATGGGCGCATSCSTGNQHANS
ncbi:hypothetical protein [Roseateles puraquae]|jgi:hypothetical protein|uniref:hypothetical protein n=1 Tax=Roseateles puraquae TaxID=431059 RepID=UPI0031D25018